MPPLSAFDSVMMSGVTPACSQANIVPVRPKPVKISSKISNAPQRSAIPRRRCSVPASWKRIPPAPCTSGSTISAGDAFGMPRQHQFERIAARRIRRQIDDDMLRQRAAEHIMHPGIGIAHRHRAGGVAVIAALERDELGLSRLAAIDPVLLRHLHRDLDRDRAGFRKEHAIEVARQQRREPPRQGQGLLVDQAAEHHMRHLGELPLHRLPDVRMVVAVAGGPPRRDAVDQLAAVGEHDAAARACARPQAAAAPSSSAYRAARRGRARLRTSDFDPSSAIIGQTCPLSMNSHGRSSARWTRRTCAARLCRPAGTAISGSSATAGGSCRSPATIILA